MILGHVRDNFPRVVLALPGFQGLQRVEFLVDTGFDGEIALPESILGQLRIEFAADRSIRLADNTVRRTQVYTIEIDWNDETRITEIIQLEGAPLVGIELLAGNLVRIEMEDGGEVTIDEL